MDHNKIITSVAKSLLKPYGFIQKGTSRCFINDNKWYSIIIEFQPHGYEKGTFLNVHACFHFYPKDYWSFDYGNRISDFIKFEDESSFTNSIIDLCQQAISYSTKLKDDLKDFETAIKTYGNYTRCDSSWKVFNLGFLYMMSGDLINSIQCFKAISEAETNYDWQLERKNICLICLEALNNNTFKDLVYTAVNQARVLKKLKPLELIPYKY